MSDSRDTRANETGLEKVGERARKWLADRAEIGWSELRVASFAQSEREAEMERCCKDVCSMCAGNIPKDFVATLEKHDRWVHVVSSKYTSRTTMKDCAADAIRERWAGKREG
jgi:hypothetical protein